MGTPTKPVPRVVRSDDCAIEVDGETYYPHDGETVTVASGLTVGDLRIIRGLQEVAPALLALEGEDNEESRQLALLDGTLATMVDFLAAKIIAWTWTDDAGNAMDQPYRNPDALNKCRMEELLWLIAAAQGETPGERKNASRPSRITSSATRQQRSRA